MVLIEVHHLEAVELVRDLLDLLLLAGLLKLDTFGVPGEEARSAQLSGWRSRRERRGKTSGDDGTHHLM